MFITRQFFVFICELNKRSTIYYIFVIIAFNPLRSNKQIVFYTKTDQTLVSLDFGSSHFSFANKSAVCGKGGDSMVGFVSLQIVGSESKGTSFVNPGNSANLSYKRTD